MPAQDDGVAVGFSAAHQFERPGARWNRGAVSAGRMGSSVKMRAVIELESLSETSRRLTRRFQALRSSAWRTAIHVRLKIGRLKQAFAGLILRHVVVTDFHRQRADAAALLADSGKKIVRHPPQYRFDIFLVGQVGSKGLLVAK